MDRKTLESLSHSALVEMVLAQDEGIRALQARVAALEEKLGLPRKTPDNSGVPPSQGVKPGLPRKTGGKRRKGRPGRHRALDPAPTRVLDLRAAHCPSCRADVSGAARGACARPTTTSTFRRLRRM